MDENQVSLAVTLWLSGVVVDRAFTSGGVDVRAQAYSLIIALPLAAHSYVLLPITIHGLHGYVSRPLPCMMLASYPGLDEKKCLFYTVCACACQHTCVYVRTWLPRNSVANKRLRKQYIPGSLSPLCLGTRLV